MESATSAITLSEGPTGGVSGKKNIMGESELQAVLSSVIAANAYHIAGKIVDHVFRDMALDRMRLTEEDLIPEYGLTGHVTFDVAAMTDILAADIWPQSLPATSEFEIGGVIAKTDFFEVIKECLDPRPGYTLNLLWLLPEIMKAVLDSGAAGFWAHLPRYDLCNSALR